MSKNGNNDLLKLPIVKCLSILQNMFAFIILLFIFTLNVLEQINLQYNTIQIECLQIFYRVHLRPGSDPYEHRILAPESSVRRQFGFLSVRRRKLGHHGRRHGIRGERIFIFSAPDDTDGRIHL
jgi:hypothetical protein